jgi:hypothetical protein
MQESRACTHSVPDDRVLPPMNVEIHRWAGHIFYGLEDSEIMIRQKELILLTSLDF